MNTRTPISEADRKAAAEAQVLADRLMVARGIDDPEQALANAFTDLMKAASRLLYARALNGRTKDELSDEEFDNLPNGSDPSIIIRVLVDDYSVEEVCKWVKAAVEEDDLFDEELGELMKAAAEHEDD